MMARLQSWALIVLAVLAVMLGAYTVGGRAARKSADRDREYDDARRAAAGAKGVHDAKTEVRNMSANDVRDELARDWVRVE